MIFIKNMAEKPEHCAGCPICDYDGCVLLPFVSDTWEEQYAKCPLVEVRKPSGNVIGYEWVLKPITNIKEGEEMDVNIKCKTEGFDEAIEEVETLADAYASFPPQVNIRNCRDCTINVYPSQTHIINCDSDYQEGYEDGYDQACMDTANDDLGSDCPWK